MEDTETGALAQVMAPTGGRVLAQHMSGSDPSIPPELMGALSTIMDPKREQRNQDAAFMEGMLAPSASGGSAFLSNAMAAQRASQENSDKLKAQYIPIIMQQLVQQRQNQLAYAQFDAGRMKDLNPQISAAVASLQSRPDTKPEDIHRAIDAVLAQNNMPPQYGQAHHSYVAQQVGTDPSKVPAFLDQVRLQITPPGDAAPKMAPNAAGQLTVQRPASGTVGPANAVPGANPTAASAAGAKVGAEEEAKLRATPVDPTLIDDRTGKPFPPGTTKWDLMRNNGQPSAPGGPQQVAALPAGNGQVADPGPEVYAKLKHYVASTPNPDPDAVKAVEAYASKYAMAPAAIRGPAQNAADTEIMKGGAGKFVDYKNKLNTDVESGWQQYNRNLEVENLLKAYGTGQLAADERMAFATRLKAAFPNSKTVGSFATRIAGGDIASGQELANLLSSAALTNVIKTLDGNGRVNKAEYQALQEHAETNKSDPDALLAIMRFQNSIYRHQFEEQQAMSEAAAKGHLDPNNWAAQWAKMRHERTTNRAALGATGTASQPAVNGKPSAPVSDFAKLAAQELARRKAAGSQ